MDLRHQVALGCHFVTVYQRQTAVNPTEARFCHVEAVAAPLGIDRGHLRVLEVASVKDIDQASLLRVEGQVGQLKRLSLELHGSSLNETRNMYFFNSHGSMLHHSSQQSHIVKFHIFKAFKAIVINASGRALASDF